MVKYFGSTATFVLSKYFTLLYLIRNSYNLIGRLHTNILDV